MMMTLFCCSLRKKRLDSSPKTGANDAQRLECSFILVVVPSSVVCSLCVTSLDDNIDRIATSIETMMLFVLFSVFFHWNSSQGTGVQVTPFLFHPSLDSSSNDSLKCICEGIILPETQSSSSPVSFMDSRRRQVLFHTKNKKRPSHFLLVLRGWIERWILRPEAELNLDYVSREGS